jgi:hypothetical protein
MSEKKKKGKGIGIIVLVFAIIILSIIFSSFVSAAPPTQVQQFTSGYVIEGTPQENVLQGRDFQYNFFVYNVSDGVPISNKSAKCSFYMANSSGTVKIYADVLYFPENYWGVLLKGGNFTTPGIHPYGVKCNSTVLGGAFVSYFIVTPIGVPLTPEKSTIYVVIWIVSLLLFAGLLTAGIKLPSKNNSNEMTGYVIAVSNMKYLKMLCLAFAYLSALFIVYYTWMLSYAYLDMAFMTSIFQTLFYAMAIAIVVLFPVMMFIIIANLVRDAKIRDLLSRGLDVKG